MNSGKDNRQVNLTVKVPILILYVTAVAEEDGSIHFFDDIYGHDRRLNALLAKGPPYPYRSHHALMLVHSFSDSHRWFEDFAAFSVVMGCFARSSQS
jgi:hypothetical protein